MKRHSNSLRILSLEKTKEVAEPSRDYRVEKQIGAGIKNSDSKHAKSHTKNH